MFFTSGVSPPQSSAACFRQKKNTYKRRKTQSAAFNYPVLGMWERTKEERAKREDESARKRHSFLVPKRKIKTQYKEGRG